MKNFLHWTIVAFAAWSLAVWAQPDLDGPTYRTNLSTMVNLGRDLQAALTASHREKIHVQPVSVDTDVMPFVRLEEYPDEPKPLPMVFISVGFIDLVNNVAHAKAIDRLKRGYFEKYVLTLARESGEKSLLELPDLANKKYWSDDVLNDQYSNFNSIVGVMLGIKLANHYLGHYHKYRTQLERADGSRIPITNLLTEKEWEEALKWGVQNALDAGCTVEGAVSFFETFDKMGTRPAWTAYFLPDNLKFKALKKSLEKIQRDYFGGLN